MSRVPNKQRRKYFKLRREAEHLITYGEFFKRQKAGEYVSEMAEAIGKTRKSVNRSLQRAGYAANARNEWVYEGEGPEPLDQPMLFGKGKGGPIAKKDRPKKTDDESSDDSTNTSKQNASDSNSKSKTSKSRQIASHSTSNSTGDSIGALLQANDSKAGGGRSYRGFYLDPDIAAIIDSVKRGGRSELVNEIIRKEFKDRGLL